MAMSGGVDSSVAVALLILQGYDVTGAFMKQWSDSAEVSGVCTWKEDRRDALRVAAALDIPLMTLDFEKEYREQVAAYMFAEYEKDRTPNPDVLCNTHIKFGVWLDWALAHGFDYLATGHYARLERVIKKTRKQENKKTVEDLNSTQNHLLQAKDTNKDQTYFLHQLDQKQLAHVMFPIGDYLKSEVRSLARRFHLPTAEREESMGICFIGEMPMKDFLLQKITKKPGKIVTTDGTIVGLHDGLPFYTIGQRHLKVGNQKPIVTSIVTMPWYVVEKRPMTNELVIGHENDALLYKKEIVLDDVRWVSGVEPTLPFSCMVRLRHRQKLEKAKITIQNVKIVLHFLHPQRAVTPGQFAVFYKNGECLGGGVIA